MTTLNPAARATIVLAVSVALVATACTSSPDTDQTSSGIDSESQRHEQEVAVARGVPVTIEIASRGVV